MIPYAMTFLAMATIGEVRVFGADMPTAIAATRAAQAEVKRIDSKYSRLRDSSVTSLINRSAGLGRQEIDAETAGLLDWVDACWAESGHLFDITAGPLHTLWRGATPEGPTSIEIKAALKSVGWQRVRHDRKAVSLEAGMEIDLGDISKEYAADRAVAILAGMNISHALVNLDGVARAIGSHLTGKPWEVDLPHPRERGVSIGKIPLSNQSLVISGDYARYMMGTGHEVRQIINPNTGTAVVGPQSTVVVAPVCMIAGSIARHAMLKGEAAHSYLVQQNLPFLIIDADRITSVNVSVNKPPS